VGEAAQILVELLSGVGFPIAITIYLLVFHDKRLREIRDEVQKNGAAIDRLNHLLTGGGMSIRGDKRGKSVSGT